MIENPTRTAEIIRKFIAAQGAPAVTALPWKPDARRAAREKAAYGR